MSPAASGPEAGMASSESRPALTAPPGQPCSCDMWVSPGALPSTWPGCVRTTSSLAWLFHLLTEPEAPEHPSAAPPLPQLWVPGRAPGQGGARACLSQASCGGVWGLEAWLRVGQLLWDAHDPGGSLAGLLTGRSSPQNGRGGCWPTRASARAEVQPVGDWRGSSQRPARGEPLEDSGCSR